MALELALLKMIEILLGTRYFSLKEFDLCYSIYSSSKFCVNFAICVFSLLPLKNSLAYSSTLVHVNKTKAEKIY